MITICATLNEGQVQCTYHVMHAHVCGRHRANFDDNGFNSFRGIACEGHTHARTQMSSMSEFGGLRKHNMTQHALYNSLGLGSATLLELAFLGESDLNLPWENFLLGQNVKTKNTRRG